MDKLAQKSSYELLIMILTDMKKFIRSNSDEPTLMIAVTCFCKFSIFEAEECCTCGENHYSKLHNIIFDGILRLTKNNSAVSSFEDFIGRMCHKLWDEHEKLLSEVNIEQSRKFKHK
jgi:hypothetical protein